MNEQALQTDTFAGSPEHVWILKGVSAFYAKGVKPPSEIGAREFGFGFTKKIDIRHKSFKTAEQLIAYLTKEIPLFISYSGALYDRPEGRPMARKGLRSAELVFDLDTPPAHDDHKSLACEQCLQLVKRDALRLAEDFLEKDFGIRKQEMTLNFSGSKGYHIHVHTKAFQDLRTNARKQLADYITGASLNPARLLYRTGKVLHGPSAQGKGWKRRVHAFAKNLLASGIQELKKGGVRAPLAKMLIENRENVLARIDEGNWDPVRGFDKLAPIIVDRAIKADAVPIDKPVTYDATRIIRLPDTIHGDTGLIAKSIPWTQAESFEPFRDALAFSTTTSTTITPSEDITLQITDRTFALQAQKKAEIPDALAAYLLLKRKARLA